MKTAIIMSKEEAMALPVKKRPICFRISSEMYLEVFEIVGEASMAWKPRPGSEVFNPEEASNVAVKLCFKIAEEVEKRELDAERSGYEHGLAEGRRNRETGITLLDAKWLDPACHKGCQSLNIAKTEYERGVKEAVEICRARETESDLTIEATRCRQKIESLLTKKDDGK